MDEKNKVLRRGQVWYYNPPAEESALDMGHIQKGPRNVIIVSNEMCNRYSPVILAVTCTTQPKKNLPTHVIFTIDGDFNTALVEQPRPIQVKHLENMKYVLDDYIMNQVDEALLIAYGLKPIPGRGQREEEQWQQETFQATRRDI